jgi:hypothetical protein
MNKTIILAIVLVLFANCKSKKIYIENTKIERDSIYLTKTIKEIERFTDTLTIEQPCDSLGNLKPFKQVISTKQGSYTLTGSNNIITANLDLKGYKEIWEKEYKSKLDKNTIIKEKEVIRYRTPLWLILLCPILYGLGYLTGKFT